ncbi:MAG: carboxymuconolactone decarboxylase family protein [Gammaproteobacteria bacterium]|nr:carboxymuconolactone decarboxylase family protein [Gammaproteobacteria bacterium]NIR24686.1 carboxymuconolactone decarboxylase family protein [Gammaproteobacteria bacterium]NIS06300.1 carboxymuconolactone decarboxylase family protein [Gammaproteobacteria bacterium]NIW03572.1 carboxymuconolactone decarboxylase family protein [Gammaproteobacteria bacterium]NIW56701.1 carboxymuconolactone decarboxylase family protein [Gammaproteobacteria bacterium]
MSRLGELRRDHLSDAERALFDAITTGKRSGGDGRSAHITPTGGLRGPFNALLHAPHVGDAVQRLGEQLRFEGLLSPRQREIGVLCVAARWRADYEWWAHARIARSCGVPDAVIAAIRRRETPPLEDQAERLVHEFSRSLLDERQVADALYDAAAAALGEAALVELVVLLGYYSLISMVLVAFQVAVPEGETPPFEDDSSPPRRC